MEDLRQRLENIRSRIAAAAARAGRPPSAVRLVAVSKTHPPGVVAQAAKLGQTLFGESRVQEAREKIPALSGDLEWHFIGHLQRNKVRQALPLFSLFHGVDRLEVAQAMDRIAGETNLRVRALLEVNIAGEASKFGYAPDLLRRELPRLLELPRVEIRGLMAMAPHADDPESARPVFRALRHLRDDLRQASGRDLPEMSMGMSGDFEIAVEEGATLVRIGTALFGERPPRE